MVHDPWSFGLAQLRSCMRRNHKPGSFMEYPKQTLSCRLNEGPPGACSVAGLASRDLWIPRRMAGSNFSSSMSAIEGPRRLLKAKDSLVLGPSQRKCPDNATTSLTSAAFQHGQVRKGSAPGHKIPACTMVVATVITT